ncbi:hypothetical protein MJO28_005530 [Puccinia striiformis f. sp. tritici]|uniref:Uncharacterized protein n=1 Tax=Puccinia striiformis f. sp. tritici TaxID=168172 RepID=A0ACC0EL55_9BASI|nr:hypothetical protein MJO28_005530 [Puccinia striiformis f. sp. tritici]
MEDSTILVANISIFNKAVAQALYGKARRFSELDFVDSPYMKGGERDGWDRSTGKPVEAKNSQTGKLHNQPPTIPVSTTD